jgi:hypothetical protein
MIDYHYNCTGQLHEKDGTYIPCLLININQSDLNTEITIELQGNGSNYYLLRDKFYSQQQGLVSDVKFELVFSDFIAHGCLIKNLSIDENSIIRLEIIPDYIRSDKNLSERRDKIIDLILNEK